MVESDSYMLPRRDQEVPRQCPEADHSQQYSRTQDQMVNVVPNEVLHQIFRYLGPKDFNSARRACSKWMFSSLDYSLLALMLKRGGWWSGIRAELRAQQQFRPPGIGGNSDAWFLSCCLARECALSSRWKGNGTDGNNSKVLFETVHVDFGDLATEHPGANSSQSGGLILTVSICNKFVLVADGGLIYVYELVGNNLRALTSIICPRRVLAMSMDGSSRRYTIAALLEGRMGIVCTLNFASFEPEIDHDAESQSTLIPGRLSLKLPADKYPHLPPAAESTSSFSETLCDHGFSHLEVQSASEVIGVRGCDDRHRDSRNLINTEWSPLPFLASRCKRGLSLTSESIPIDIGRRIIYRQLCCDEDPPRSVAVCPQRQCVAFGCSAGLELHWTDARSGRGLNRWFPLSGPSDYLYFLQAREGIDTSRKLRLISSAAHPTQRPALGRKFYAPRPLLSSLWGDVGFSEFEQPSFSEYVRDSDHYHAVPLADGFHMLFSDPDTSMLCLGGDAPLGDPKRLHRKLMLVPPEDGALASVYTGGREIGGSVRVVAVYGESKWILVDLLLPVRLGYQFVARNACDLGFLTSKMNSNS